MSQKSARTMRKLGETQASLSNRVADMESALVQVQITQEYLFPVINNKTWDAMQRTVKELEREQRRQRNCRERVTLLVGMITLCIGLVGLSLRLFGLM